MLFLMFLIIFSNAPSVVSDSAGTVLFNERKYYPECWHADQVAKLRARKILEDIIPPEVPVDQIDRKYAKTTLRYFRSAVYQANKSENPYTAGIIREAIADTIGSHLRREILPNVKFAYYAGFIPYKDVRSLYDLYDDMKTVLNTQGIGWRPPARIPLQSNLTVGKIVIGLGKLNDPCSCLVVTEHPNQCLHLAVPRLDDDHNPSAMVLPFKNGGLISLYSPNSENILLEYFTTATRCILNSSPEICRHSDFVNFNNELWHWMKKSIAPRLMDEKLYPALGGVLRVAAAVQTYGKGLTRRNLLYEFEDDRANKWHLFRALSQTGVYINTDWSPQLYIAIVLIIGGAMCCMQLFYDKILSRRRGCCCIGRRPSSLSTRKDIAYTSVDTNFPAVLPMHYSRPPSRPTSAQVNKSTLNKSKMASTGTVKTQRVYDLNENTEKLMSVIMSDNECSDADGSSSTTSGEDLLQKTVIDMRSVKVNSQKSQKSKSPPRIDAVVAQLKIDKPTATDTSKTNVYLTDTATETTFYHGRLSDTGWSESSSTSISATTTSIKSHGAKLRDLAWARRVACKQRRRACCSQSNTATEVNSYVGSNSFTTPPSRR